MKYMGKPFVVLLIGITVVFLFSVLDARNRRMKLTEQEKQRIASELTQSYIKGFTDGLNSAVNNIEFNTNAGSFHLEMTNVFKDMKP